MRLISIIFCQSRNVSIKRCSPCSQCQFITLLCYCKTNSRGLLNLLLLMGLFIEGVVFSYRACLHSSEEHNAQYKPTNMSASTADLPMNINTLFFVSECCCRFVIPDRMFVFANTIHSFVYSSPLSALRKGLKDTILNALQRLKD